MRLMVWAWLGSLALIAGALFFQYGMGLAPCQLCYWQRIPHILVIMLGAWAIWRAPRLAVLMALLMLVSAGLALYHVGVEEHWWQGFTSCSADIGTISVEALLEKPAVRCDEIPWSFLGLSMAAWNGIISLVLAGIWARAAKQ